ncbi:MAG: HAD-IA family hydrolase [Pseudohongiella sp.]|nr:HAD-IA family hydrolase [Pseudohongiella sp.]
MNSANQLSGNVTKLSTQGCVLFDLDGTLLDTAADFQAVLNVLCIEQGVTPPTTAAIHSTVSSGARALISLAFELEQASDQFDILLQQLLNQYLEQIGRTKTTLYPGMDVLLQKLESLSIPWGVVTNKPVRFSEPLLRNLQLHNRCAVLICPDHVTHSKPHPEPLLLACERVGRQPELSIYVGDHPRDITAGKAAGMKTIAAAYGYLPAEPCISSWGADMIVNNVSEVTQLFWPVGQAVN